MAFTSNESGHSEVYLQAFANEQLRGPRHRVSNSAGYALRWRRDGRELFYLGLDGKVNAVPVQLGARPEFGAVATLFTVSVEERAAVHSIIGFDVTADGKRFLIPMVDPNQEGPVIVVARNWDAGR